MIRLMSVSYTHLDVYKRQHTILYLLPSDETRDGIGETNTLMKRQVCLKYRKYCTSN